MPRNDWSVKRERQYDHIKQSLRDHGKGTKLAEEIAARTVKKEGAQHGEAKEASASSVNGISSGRRRGGLRSHNGVTGRKPYRHHAHWRSARDETKFDRMQAFGAALPRTRARVKRDLAAQVGERLLR